MTTTSRTRPSPQEPNRPKRWERLRVEPLTAGPGPDVVVPSNARWPPTGVHGRRLQRCSGRLRRINCWSITNFPSTQGLKLGLLRGFRLVGIR
jgi:hypothetical protein